MRLEPPQRYYEYVGRVAVAASNLEAQIATVAYLASGTELGEPGDAWRAAGQPGGALRALREAIEHVPDDELRAELGRLADDAAERLDQRNELVHSVLVLETGEDREATDRWFAFHPRGGSERPLPSDTEAAELLRRIQALAARALMLSGRVADSLRTADGGGAR